ncbi:MAG: serine/threonine protein kinase [Myxococcota bacterium]|nr:serine/threonine protein kinase [Myxococcota bacterium]
MADIFLCRQVGMGGFDRLVVVKQIRPELRSRDDVIHMFLDEARIAAQISHPNVVQIIEIDEADGLPYIAMEYVRGLPLSVLLEAMLRRELLPPWDLVAAIGSQVCSGLHAAHELRDSDGTLLNVVHRDISPANLLITTDGVVKIIDFGIARAKNRLARTATGHIKGRPAYLAPEMMSQGRVDRRADLFALGAVLHELMRGRALFDRHDNASTISAVMTAGVPPLSECRPDVPPQLEEIIRRALCKDPEARFQTAAEMGAALHAVAMQTGRYVSPLHIAQYLERLLPLELAALPEQHLPTTARLPLPEHRPAPSRPTLISPRPLEQTTLLRTIQDITERMAGLPRWQMPLLLALLAFASVLAAWSWLR